MITSFLFMAVAASAALPKASAPPVILAAGAASAPRAASAASSTALRLAAPLLARSPLALPASLALAASPVAAPAPAPARALVEANRLAAVLAPAAADQDPIRGGKDAPPALEGLTYSPAVSAEHRGLLESSLRRRRTAWLELIKRAGFAAGSPDAPALYVEDAHPRGGGGRVDFRIAWTQGPMKRGAFHVEVKARTTEPGALRPSSPAIPSSSEQVLLRFKDGITAEGVEAFLRRHGLQYLGRAGGGLERALISRAEDSVSVAARLSKDAVLAYAMPGAGWVSKERLLDVALVNDRPGQADEALRLFLDAGYVVMKADGTRYRLAAPEGAAPLGAELRSKVLYANRSVAAAIPEDAHVVLRWAKEVTDETMAAVLRAPRIRIIADYGDRTFKIALTTGKSASELAETLRFMVSDFGLEFVTPVGSLPAGAVEAAAARAASYKSSLYAASEYDRAVWEEERALELKGASKAQLEAYRSAVNAAPMKGERFNSWSGD